MCEFEACSVGTLLDDDVVLHVEQRAAIEAACYKDHKNARILEMYYYQSPEEQPYEGEF